MWPVVTKVARGVVCLGTRVSPAKTAEPIEMALSVWTHWDSRKQVLNGGCTLASHGEYDRSILAAAALWAYVKFKLCHT